MSENTNSQNKPVSRWTAATIGKLWKNSDGNGGIKNFSGSITIEGKEYKVLVMKRLKYDNDDPNKNYPSLIIYDSAKLDGASGKTAPATNKAVKKQPVAAVQESSPEDELM